MELKILFFKKKLRIVCCARDLYDLFFFFQSDVDTRSWRELFIWVKLFRV